MKVKLDGESKVVSKDKKVRRLRVMFVCLTLALVMVLGIGIYFLVDGYQKNKTALTPEQKYINSLNRNSNDYIGQSVLDVTLPSGVEPSEVVYFNDSAIVTFDGTYNSIYVRNSSSFEIVEYFSYGETNITDYTVEALEKNAAIIYDGNKKYFVSLITHEALLDVSNCKTVFAGNLFFAGEYINYSIDNVKVYSLDNVMLAVTLSGLDNYSDFFVGNYFVLYGNYGNDKYYHITNNGISLLFEEGNEYSFMPVMDVPFISNGYETFYLPVFDNFLTESNGNVLVSEYVPVEDPTDANYQYDISSGGMVVSPYYKVRTKIINISSGESRYVYLTNGIVTGVACKNNGYTTLKVSKPESFDASGNYIASSASQNVQNELVVDENFNKIVAYSQSNCGEIIYYSSSKFVTSGVNNSGMIDSSGQLTNFIDTELFYVASKSVYGDNYIFYDKTNHNFGVANCNSQVVVDAVFRKLSPLVGQYAVGYAYGHYYLLNLETKQAQLIEDFDANCFGLVDAGMSYYIAGTGENKNLYSFSGTVVASGVVGVYALEKTNGYAKVIVESQNSTKMIAFKVLNDYVYDGFKNGTYSALSVNENVNCAVVMTFGFAGASLAKNQEYSVPDKSLEENNAPLSIHAELTSTRDDFQSVLSRHEDKLKDNFRDKEAISWNVGTIKRITDSSSLYKDIPLFPVVVANGEVYDRVDDYIEYFGGANVPGLAFGYLVLERDEYYEPNGALGCLFSSKDEVIGTLVPEFIWSGKITDSALINTFGDVPIYHDGTIFFDLGQAVIAITRIQIDREYYYDDYLYGYGYTYEYGQNYTYVVGVALKDGVALSSGLVGSIDVSKEYDINREINTYDDANEYLNFSLFYKRGYNYDTRKLDEGWFGVPVIGGYFDVDGDVESFAYSINDDNNDNAGVSTIGGSDVSYRMFYDDNVIRGKYDFYSGSKCAYVSSSDEIAHDTVSSTKSSYPEIYRLTNEDINDVRFTRALHESSAVIVDFDFAYMGPLKMAFDLLLDYQFRSGDKVLETPYFSAEMVLSKSGGTVIKQELKITPTFGYKINRVSYWTESVKNKYDAVNDLNNTGVFVIDVSGVMGSLVGDSLLVSKLAGFLVEVESVDLQTYVYCYKQGDDEAEQDFSVAVTNLYYIQEVTPGGTIESYNGYNDFGALACGYIFNARSLYYDLYLKGYTLVGLFVDIDESLDADESNDNCIGYVQDNEYVSRLGNFDIEQGVVQNVYFERIDLVTVLIFGDENGELVNSPDDIWKLSNGSSMIHPNEMYLLFSAVQGRTMIESLKAYDFGNDGLNTFVSGLSGLPVIFADGLVAFSYKYMVQYGTMGGDVIDVYGTGDIASITDFLADVPVFADDYIDRFNREDIFIGIIPIFETKEYEEVNFVYNNPYGVSLGAGERFVVREKLSNSIGASELETVKYTNFAYGNNFGDDFAVNAVGYVLDSSNNIKAYYIFKGWNTSAGGTGDMVSFGADGQTLSDDIDYDCDLKLTFYAKFEKQVSTKDMTFYGTIGYHVNPTSAMTESPFTTNSYYEGKYYSSISEGTSYVAIPVNTDIISSGKYKTDSGNLYLYHKVSDSVSLKLGAGARVVTSLLLDGYYMGFITATIYNHNMIRNVGGTYKFGGNRIVIELTAMPNSVTDEISYMVTSAKSYDVITGAVSNISNTYISVQCENIIIDNHSYLLLSFIENSSTVGNGDGVTASYTFQAYKREVYSSATNDTVGRNVIVPDTTVDIDVNGSVSATVTNGNTISNVVVEKNTLMSYALKVAGVADSVVSANVLSSFPSKIIYEVKLSNGKVYDYSTNSYTNNSYICMLRIEINLTYSEYIHQNQTYYKLTPTVSAKLVYYTVSGLVLTEVNPSVLYFGASDVYTKSSEGVYSLEANNKTLLSSDITWSSYYTYAYTAYMPVLAYNGTTPVLVDNDAVHAKNATYFLVDGSSSPTVTGENRAALNFSYNNITLSPRNNQPLVVSLVYHATSFSRVFAQFTAFEHTETVNVSQYTAYDNQYKTAVVGDDGLVAGTIKYVRGNGNVNSGTVISNSGEKIVVGGSDKLTSQTSTQLLITPNDGYFIKNISLTYKKDTYNTPLTFMLLSGGIVECSANGVMSYSATGYSNTSISSSFSSKFAAKGTGLKLLNKTFESTGRYVNAADGSVLLAFVGLNSDCSIDITFGKQDYIVIAMSQSDLDSYKVPFGVNDKNMLNNEEYRKLMMDIIIDSITFVGGTLDGQNYAYTQGDIHSGGRSTVFDGVSESYACFIIYVSADYDSLVLQFNQNANVFTTIVDEHAIMSAGLSIDENTNQSRITIPGGIVLARMKVVLGRQIAFENWLGIGTTLLTDTMFSLSNNMITTDNVEEHNQTGSVYYYRLDRSVSSSNANFVTANRIMTTSGARYNGTPNATSKSNMLPRDSSTYTYATFYGTTVTINLSKANHYSFDHIEVFWSRLIDGEYQTTLLTGEILDSVSYDTSSITITMTLADACMTNSDYYTVSAYYMADEYDIIYNENGGERKDGAAEHYTSHHVYNVQPYIPAALSDDSSVGLQKLGYTLVGFSYDQKVNTQNGTIYARKYTYDVVVSNNSGNPAKYNKNFVYDSNKIVYLYAIWYANNYTISYDNNASGGQGSTPAVGSGGGAAGVYFDHDLSRNVSNVSAYTLRVIDRTGYTFLGWSVKARINTADYTAADFEALANNLNGTINASIPYLVDESFILDADTIGLLNSSNQLELHGVWRPLIFTVQFNPNDSTVGGVGSSPAQLYLDNAVITDNGQFTVKFDTAFGTLPVLKRVGYNFAGFVLSLEGDSAKTRVDSETELSYTRIGRSDNYTQDKTNFTGTITLYATWSAQTFYIYYSLNKHNLEGVNENDVLFYYNDGTKTLWTTEGKTTYQQTVVFDAWLLLNSAESNLYDFNGWRKTPTGGVLTSTYFVFDYNFFNSSNFAVYTDNLNAFDSVVSAPDNYKGEYPVGGNEYSNKITFFAAFSNKTDRIVRVRDDTDPNIEINTNWQIQKLNSNNDFIISYGNSSYLTYTYYTNNIKVLFTPMSGAKLKRIVISGTNANIGADDSSRGFSYEYNFSWTSSSYSLSVSGDMSGHNYVWKDIDFTICNYDDTNDRNVVEILFTMPKADSISIAFESDWQTYDITVKTKTMNQDGTSAVVETRTATVEYGTTILPDKNIGRYDVSRGQYVKLFDRNDEYKQGYKFFYYFKQITSYTFGVSGSGYYELLADNDAILYLVGDNSANDGREGRIRASNSHIGSNAVLAKNDKVDGDETYYTIYCQVSEQKVTFNIYNPTAGEYQEWSSYRLTWWNDGSIETGDATGDDGGKCFDLNTGTVLRIPSPNASYWPVGTVFVGYVVGPQLTSVQAGKFFTTSYDKLITNDYSAGQMFNAGSNPTYNEWFDGSYIADCDLSLYAVYNYKEFDISISSSTSSKVTLSFALAWAKIFPDGSSKNFTTDSVYYVVLYDETLNTGMYYDYRYYLSQGHSREVALVLACDGIDNFKERMEQANIRADGTIEISERGGYYFFFIYDYSEQSAPIDSYVYLVASHALYDSWLIDTTQS